MASSYTDIGTELMATGENAGTWGTKTNTNIQILEEAINGYVSQALTSSGTVALTYTDGSTGDVARHAVIALTGTITGNAVVTVPANEKVWIIDNQSSGAYTVTVKVSGQTGVTWGTSDKGTKILYANGTDVVDTNIGGGVGAQDLNGEELILDADADTSITADTDDQIDIKIAGADDFQFTANTFTAQSGSTIAAQALTATTVTASGILKTDDTTEATSTTDGSLQTDGGLSVAKDAVIGDDLKLLSDSAVLSFGADSDVSLTHVADTALLLNAAMRLQFRDSGLYIGSNADGDLDVVSDGTAVDSINLESAGGITLDAGTAGSGIVYEDDGTEMARIHNSSSDVILETKVSDKDFLIKGNDGGSTITALTFDMSAAGAATFNDKIVATELDISGDVDIDGTLEADAYTLGGSAFIKLGGTNFSNSLLIGHATTGTLSSAEKNTGVGLAALDAITQGDKNVAVGYSSGSSITTGNRNMVFGNEAGDGLTTGSDNVNIGDSAAYYNVSGGENVAIGKSAMQGASGQSNSYNIALGVDALKNITTGGRNIGIGYQSGDNITSGSGNVMIGAGIDLGSATGSRQLKIAGNDGSTTTTWISGDNSGNLTFPADVAAASLDISGNMDIDGTSNLDNTDIDGTLAVDGTTISLDATTSLNIDNSNTSNGITIGTATSGVPISIGHTTSEVTVNDNLTITGDLTVNGTTTTVNSTTVTIDDPIFTLGGDTAPGSDDNKDRGIEFRYHDGSSARIGFMGYDDSAEGFAFLTAASNSSEVFSGTEAKLIAGSLDISGDADIDGTLEADAITLGGSAFIKLAGTNFTGSLLLGHATTGTLNAAQYNTGVGVAALDALTSGDTNTAVGYSAATAVTTGSLNTFIGYNAGAAATDMQGCIAIGASALSAADPGNNNIAIGESAGLNITGVRNLCIGENAGDNITSGSGNVIIGSAVDPSSATGDRQLKIAGNDGSTTTNWISGDSNGVVTLADDLVIKDGGTIGVSSDADSITIASNGAVTFSQAPVFPDGSIAVADLDIDGATDIGEAIVDADLFIVDNGAGGTNRKVAASRLVTYIDANSSAASTGKAIAMALVFG